MGCTSSNNSFDSSESSYGANMPRRYTPRKRNFSNRVESTMATSGLATDDSRRNSSASSWSQCSTPPPPQSPPPPPPQTSSSKPSTKSQIKRSVFPKINRKDMPKALARLTLGNKMSKTKQEIPLRPLPVLERSYGYFSGSTDNLDSSSSSSNSSFSHNSMLLHTKDIEESSVEEKHHSSSNNDDTSLHNAGEPVSNLKMEILMMRENIKLMPVTSTPFCARRNATASRDNVNNYNNYGAPSATYCRWRQYLQHLPSYSLQNVTAVPEAIAGQFSPSDHPAYTELYDFECVSAPKRYRIQPRNNANAAPAIVPGYGVTRIIESTEL